MTTTPTKMLATHGEGGGTPFDDYRSYGNGATPLTSSTAAFKTDPSSTAGTAVVRRSFG